MFSFIHTYTEASFPGLIKRGLWRDGDGLKLMHKPGFLPPFDFNSALSPGAPLETLLTELGCPFYVDRLQGGLGYTNTYPYRPATVRRLSQTLGERFLGFQMHEWASNLRSDMKRILALFDAEGASPDDPDAWRSLWRRVQNKETDLFIEAYSPQEWEAQTPFYSTDAFITASDRLYRRRTEETGGRLIPADSYFMAPRVEIQNGAKLLLPEIGWQIPNQRLQLALTRGMAKAAGIPWGVYYECWQDTVNAGFTIPFSLRAGQDEWQEDLLRKGNGADLPPERREHGGSALDLAERSWRLAYFSGARYLGEEYGVCNTFRDLTEYPLSPYGEMKREFLRFTERFPDVGEPYAPLAAVLSKELRYFDEALGERYLEYPAESPGCPFTPAQYEAFRQTAEALFGVPGRYGNCGHVLKNGGLPAVVDVVYEDMPQALQSYAYLIDLTPGQRLNANYSNVVSVQQADRLLDALLPCRVDGGLFTAYNRTKGGWFMLVMNNDGVFHDHFQPDQKIPEAAVTARLIPRGADTRITKAAGSGKLLPDGSVRLEAGAWLLLKTEAN